MTEATSEPMKPLLVIPLLLLLIWQTGAQARLTIEITGGTEGAQPIAIVPFARPEGGGVFSEDVAAIIAADLARTGRFRPMPRRDMMATPHTPEEVDLRDWRLVTMDNLVIGKVERAAVGGYDVSFVLFDVFRGKQLTAMTFTSRASELRYTAHRIADLIYERLTGSPGVAATRIAYVTSDRNRGGQRVKLDVADADATIHRPSCPPETLSCPRPGHRTDGSWPMSPSRIAGPPSIFRNWPRADGNGSQTSRASMVPRPGRRMAAAWR